MLVPSSELGRVELRERERCLRAVADEPEMPGEMPDDMWTTLRDVTKRNDREAMTEVLRTVVRLTKAGIHNRILPPTGN